jgi:hypothetical protein
MAKYKLELKPVKMQGIESLPEDRLQFFHIMLTALSQLIMMVEGVTKATVTDEYYLEIEASEAVEATLSKFHDQAIISRTE